MTIPPWTYSSIKLFETCPRKYEAERITKEVKFTDNEATIYGSAVHKAAEDYIKSDKAVQVPSKYRFLQPTLDALHRMKGDKYCELKLAVAIRDGQYVACEFFADDVWWRGVADLVIVNGDKAKIVDYKTNKNTKYADIRQLALLATALFIKYPEVKHIKALLAFVVCNELVFAEYDYDRRFDIYAQLDSLLTMRKVAYNTGVFNAKTNGLCFKYCEVLSCPHNGRNR